VTGLHLLPYPLLLPVPAALAARSLAERLEPRAATWMLTGSALALAALSTAALGMLAGGGLIRLSWAAWAGHWSTSTVRAGDPVTWAEAVPAGLLLAAAAYAVAKAALATKRTRARALAPSAALGILGRRPDPHAKAGPVPRRVAALIAPPLPRSPLPALFRCLLPLTTTTVMAGVSALCAFAAAHDFHLLLEIAGNR
jgi:hypothetical protein